ncbi:MAG: ribonuclease P protein component [Candidatus Coproplasma sp.]
MKYLRLKKSGDFTKLFSKGKRVYSPYLTVIYLPSKETVMGVAISKKHGKAVKRNRIKRLVRAAFIACNTQLNGCYSMVIMPKVCEQYSFDEFVKSLNICLKRMGK